MQKADAIPWEKIYYYVLKCGRVHSPYQFAVTALEEMGSLVQFDEGLLYFLDENRRVCEQYLKGIKSRWSNAYIGYYSNLQGDRYNLNTSQANESVERPYIHFIDWELEEQTEFMRNYIMARGLKYSLAFVLFDQKGMPRVAFSLDRMKKRPFTEREITIVSHVVAQLDNLYKNFHTDPAEIPGREKGADEAFLDLLLTKREREVVDLLCQGLSPTLVSSTLKISISTTYKHIAHIYKKLHVSSQQELLVRVLHARNNA